MATRERKKGIRLEPLVIVFSFFLFVIVKKYILFLFCFRHFATGYSDFTWFCMIKPLTKSKPFYSQLWPCFKPTTNPHIYKNRIEPLYWDKVGSRRLHRQAAPFIDLWANLLAREWLRQGVRCRCLLDHQPAVKNQREECCLKIDRFLKHSSPFFEFLWILSCTDITFYGKIYS